MPQFVDGPVRDWDARWNEDESKLDMEKTAQEAYTMLTPSVPRIIGALTCPICAMRNGSRVTGSRN